MIKARVKDIRKLPNCPEPDEGGSYDFSYTNYSFSFRMIEYIEKILEVKEINIYHYTCGNYTWHKNWLDFNYYKPKNKERKFYF